MNHAIRPTAIGNVPACGAADGAMAPGGITCQQCLDTMRGCHARDALEAARADEYVASGAVTAAWAALRVAERAYVDACEAHARATLARREAEREAGR